MYLHRMHNWLAAHSPKTIHCVTHPNIKLIALSEFNVSPPNTRLDLTIGQVKLGFASKHFMISFDFIQIQLVLSNSSILSANNKLRSAVSDFLSFVNESIPCSSVFPGISIVNSRCVWRHLLGLQRLCRHRQERVGDSLKHVQRPEDEPAEGGDGIPGLPVPAERRIFSAPHSNPEVSPGILNWRSKSLVTLWLGHWCWSSGQRGEIAS